LRGTERCVEYSLFVALFVAALGARLAADAGGAGGVCLASAAAIGVTPILISTTSKE
jgi:hypothetical protein